MSHLSFDPSQLLQGERGRRLSAAGHEHVAKTGLCSLQGRKDFPGDLYARIVDLLSRLATDEAIRSRLSDR